MPSYRMHDEASGGTPYDVALTPVGAQYAQATSDGGPAWAILTNPQHSANMTAGVAVTTAPSAGMRQCIDDLVISTDTAMTFILTESTSATELGRFYLPANSTLPLTLRNGIRTLAANYHVIGTASVAGNVSIMAKWHEVA